MAKTPDLSPKLAQVGDIVSAMLTEVQFQALKDSTWVLMDGRDVTGSEYNTITGNTTLPDARGQHLRGENNGRVDGQENPDATALGGAQTDAMQGHNHLGTGAGSNEFLYRRGANGIYNDPFAGGTVYDRNTVTAGTETTNGVDGTPRIGNESRPKSITINYFIKIN